MKAREKVRPVGSRALPLPDIEPLSRSDRSALCACCHRRPRRDDGQPLAVWMGKPSLRAPAVCVCHVCLAMALFRIGVSAEELQEMADMVRVIDKLGQQRKGDA